MWAYALARPALPLHGVTSRGYVMPAIQLGLHPSLYVDGNATPLWLCTLGIVRTLITKLHGAHASWEGITACAAQGGEYTVDTPCSQVMSALKH